MLGRFGGAKAGLWHGGGDPGPRRPRSAGARHHVASGKPRREASGRDGFGTALLLLQGCPGSVLGAGCSCPASSTSKMLSGLGPRRGGTAQPQVRGPLCQGIPSLIRVPSRGEEAPSLYWWERGSQSGPTPGMRDPWGKGGSFTTSSGTPNACGTGRDLVPGARHGAERGNAGEPSLA